MAAPGPHLQLYKISPAGSVQALAVEEGYRKEKTVFTTEAERGGATKRDYFDNSPRRRRDAEKKGKKNIWRTLRGQR